MAVEFRFDRAARQLVRGARTLHDRSARRTLPTHEERHADGPLVTNHRNLGRCAVLQHVQQRNDRVCREIDVILHTARLVDAHAERKLDELQLREQPSRLLIRERGENLIVTRIGQSTCTQGYRGRWASANAIPICALGHSSFARSCSERCAHNHRNQIGAVAHSRAWHGLRYSSFGVPRRHRSVTHRPTDSAHAFSRDTRRTSVRVRLGAQP